MPHTGPVLSGKGSTDYERYVRTEELLALQKSPEQLAHPEEHLFQVMHQTAEIWLKHVDFEIDRIAAAIDADDVILGAALFERCTLIVDHLARQILILETMAPADYHVIRLSSLGRGSGQESPGFNRLLDVGRRIWPRFAALLERRQLTPLAIERAPHANAAMHRLVQSMLGYDEAFMRWRFTHMRLAMRVIGSRVKSLKDVPVTQLESGTREALFPPLWETISDLTDETRPSY